MRGFSPAHITGFFAACRDADPMKAGSIGCGLCLEAGARTEVEAAAETEILLNGTVSEAPVSRFVVDRLARAPVRVKTELEIPLGSGFGASGAGALGCAHALNALFDLGLTANQAASVAHAAEVVNKTGLGDVAAQNAGGLVIRLRPGAPGRGEVDRIPIPPSAVCCVVRGPLSTAEILTDAAVMKEVNHAGTSCLKELLRRPTLKEFMRLSRDFALQTGLASSWTRDAMEAAEAGGGMASMVMLGEAVFSFGAARALKEFGAVRHMRISQRGAGLD
jgi:pantoate kinase